MTTMAARVIHLTIETHWSSVYAYASKPENMTEWAAGLAAGLTQVRDNEWVGDGGPIGSIRINFSPDNAFGVIDHTVTLDNGLSVHNAFRVVPNGDGAEVMFTLLKQAGMTDEAFEEDARAVEKDLRRLKGILEQAG